MNKIKRVKSVTEFHKLYGLSSPKHPLISVVKHTEMIQPEYAIDIPIAYDLFQIAFKMCSEGSFTYGRNTYDYHEGTMLFMAPGQVLIYPRWDKKVISGGWSVIFHPDLIRKSELGFKISGFNFFSYDANESLHLSEDEKEIIHECRKNIEREINRSIDQHSQNLIISNIGLMLNYAQRFYDRQFYTRTNFNKDIVSKFENLLRSYYNQGEQLEYGIPTVKYCAEKLNQSPNYLSDLLKKETGRSAKEHIHSFVIEKAKNVLLGSEKTVSQISCELGFEYPQSFGKLFKNKTGMSPAEYRIKK